MSTILHDNVCCQGMVHSNPTLRHSSSVPHVFICARQNRTYGHPNLMTYEAAGSAVMSPPHQSVERLFALHTHRHFIVADPSGGTLPQLCILWANKCMFSVWGYRETVSAARGKTVVWHLPTLPRLLSVHSWMTHFSAGRSRWSPGKPEPKHITLLHFTNTYCLNKMNTCMCCMYLDPACLVLLWAEEEKVKPELE